MVNYIFPSVGQSPAVAKTNAFKILTQSLGRLVTRSQLLTSCPEYAIIDINWCRSIVLRIDIDPPFC
jgi:hypothetical protein